MEPAFPCNARWILFFSVFEIIFFHVCFRGIYVSFPFHFSDDTYAKLGKIL